MKILYTTDLHGHEGKYERILQAARECGASAVVNGGDMYPVVVPLREQHRFVTGFLDRHFAEYERSGLSCLCMPGNDDLAAFDGLLDATCRKHSGVWNIAQRKVELAGYEFIGFNRVVDYPFLLKDRCRMDEPDYEFGAQLGPGLVSEGSWPHFKGLRELADWKAHARSFPTIAEELARLAKPAEPAKTAYVIHMPPSGLGLDVCGDGREVGSVAVREFLLGTQPLLSMHGHIHESPDVTGVWKTRLGRTTVIQPGQTGRLTYVVIDLERVGERGGLERVVE